MQLYREKPALCTVCFFYSVLFEMTFISRPEGNFVYLIRHFLTAPMQPRSFFSRSSKVSVAVLLSAGQRTLPNWIRWTFTSGEKRNSRCTVSNQGISKNSSSAWRSSLQPMEDQPAGASPRMLWREPDSVSTQMVVIFNTLFNRL